ncbi:amidohydrolase [Mahella sp.]|uniref:amidohydrolase n=1 Tax=Mahella sp. TaxID=2798721 RepID=UPI0025C1E62A|nr:amidohydrolase [Mahella sp.]MBZ4665976.1 amidohydrolase [Mahella sp.]
MNTLIKNVLAVTMDERHPVIKDAFIEIKGDTIERIGEPDEIPGDCRVIDGHGRIAMPGLVNCHTHVGMTLFRGYADDMPLMRWLNDRIWPLEDKLTPEMAYHASLLGILEMIKAGVTSFADMYFFMDKTAQAALDSGVRAVLARGLQDDDKGDMRLEENRRLYMDWNDAGDGRINIMVGPHAVYTCNPEYLEKAADLAAELHTGVHMHLSETQQEVDDCMAAYGCSPIELVHRAGLTAFPMIAAHCVYPVGDDIALLKANNINVAYNPVSNMKLGSGFCPVDRYINQGIRVGLGTDSAASNNNLSIFKEMHAAALIDKGRLKDPVAMPAWRILRSATVDGAAALGIDKAGVLKPGMKADIILLDVDGPHAHPLYDPVSHIVYSAKDTDVDTVIIDGRVIMEHKEVKTIDEERLYHDVERLVSDFEY